MPRDSSDEGLGSELRSGLQGCPASHAECAGAVQSLQDLRHGDGSSLHLPELLCRSQQHAALPLAAAVPHCWMQLHFGCLHQPSLAREGHCQVQLGQVSLPDFVM